MLSTKALKLVSWNIWFDQFEQLSRWNEISSTFRNLNPDIICLQEVTYEYLTYLQDQSWIKAYASSDEKLDGKTFRNYGNIMLVKRELSPSFSFQFFPTNMGRKLVIAKIPIENDYFYAATVHLESLDNQFFREKQLEVCSKFLSPNTTNILCGDFNFCSYRNFFMPKDSTNVRLDNQCLESIVPYMRDIWPLLHPTDKGYTFDSTVNSLVRQYECMRYDRVLYNNKMQSTNELESNNEKRLQLESVLIELIGNTPISNTPISSMPSNLDLTTSNNNQIQKDEKFQSPIRKRNIFPSDHFGLYVEFKIHV